MGEPEQVQHQWNCIAHMHVHVCLLVVSEPDPRRIKKEGLVDKVGWKCTLRNVRNFIKELPQQVKQSAEPDTCTSILIFRTWCLQLSKMKQNLKMAPINSHQNANQKPIRSAPAYRAQCTLPPQPIYQTLL